MLVEAFGPQMPAALGIDELRVEPHSIAGVLHAAFENVSNAQFATDLADIDRPALVGESGAAGDYKCPGTAREIGYQRFGDTVDKRIVLRAPANVEEGQNHDRESRRTGFADGGEGCGLAFRARSCCRWARCWRQFRLDRREARGLP